MNQIEINNHEWAGETIIVQYFLDNEEHYLDIEFTDLIRHVEECGLNEGHSIRHLESGEADVEDYIIEPEIWLEENTTKALESYLKYFHKSKSFN